MPSFPENTMEGKIIHHEFQGKPWEVIAADMVPLSNKNYLCIVDYHSKIPVIKKTEDLSTNSLILKCKSIIFQNMVYPRI